MFEISDSSEIKGQLNFLKDFKPLTEILTVPYIYLFIQNEIKRLYDQLVKNKTSLQQSLNEISGQTIDEKLQVIKLK